MTLEIKNVSCFHMTSETQLEIGKHLQLDKDGYPMMKILIEDLEFYLKALHLEKD